MQIYCHSKYFVFILYAESALGYRIPNLFYYIAGMPTQEQFVFTES